MSNIINGTATDYEMPAKNYVSNTDYNSEDEAIIGGKSSRIISADEADAIVKVYEQKMNANSEYAYRRKKNKEYYPDPTYHKAADNSEKRYAPVYKSHKSKRYELIGAIIRMCDIAGFELADRIVLRDKETGEVLK